MWNETALLMQVIWLQCSPLKRNHPCKQSSSSNIKWNVGYWCIMSGKPFFFAGSRRIVHWCVAYFLKNTSGFEFWVFFFSIGCFAKARVPGWPYHFTHSLEEEGIICVPLYIYIYIYIYIYTHTHTHTHRVVPS